MLDLDEVDVDVERLISSAAKNKQDVLDSSQKVRRKRKSKEKTAAARHQPIRHHISGPIAYECKCKIRRPTLSALSALVIILNVNFLAPSFPIPSIYHNYEFSTVFSMNITFRPFPGRLSLSRSSRTHTHRDTTCICNHFK